MDSVASLSNQERRELFEQTAQQMGVNPAIAEKDFWVCWVLKKLFESELQSQLVFKGGTSLSKVYGLINRFSEDIDLVLNWELLGYEKDSLDPWMKQPSNNQQHKFNQQFNDRAQAYIEETLQPLVTKLLASCPGAKAEVSQHEPQVINVTYPAAFSLAALRPEVKLEIGALASWVPSARHTIRPYAAERFPQVFENPDCEIVAITAERTFWEKATILHQQAHRTSPMPPGYSRHYFDMFHMANSPVKQNALSDLPLLAKVVEFKNRFYRSPWAKHDLAVPGTIRLLPTEQGNIELQKDYINMQAMIFDSPPDWSAIIDSLRSLEFEINALA